MCTNMEKIYISNTNNIIRLYYSKGRRNKNKETLSEFGGTILNLSRSVDNV